MSFKIIRCEMCKKEMMPGFDNHAPFNCLTCKPEDVAAYRDWQIAKYELEKDGLLESLILAEDMLAEL